ncbi:MAG: RDD family protein [Acidimicrobiia bacterium]|jgi:uncharacterized RDD family membrane protein YckC
MTTPEPPAPQQPAVPSPLADWGTRALGFLIDWAPIFILNLIFYRVTFIGLLIWLVSIAYIAYLGHLDGLTGQTPGKAMMGIKVVNTQGELIGSGSGIGRKFAHILDGLICGLGWLLPLVDAKRQTLADKVMTTYVVTGAEKKPFSIDLWTAPKA